MGLNGDSAGLSTDDDLTGQALILKDVFDKVTESIGDRGMFCWHAERVLILLDEPVSGATRRLLSNLNRGLASREWVSGGVSLPLTPATGYVDLRLVKSPPEIWSMMEAAVDSAKASLEIEPCGYSQAVKSRWLTRLLPNPVKLWGRVPHWYQLAAQLVISLLIGLGGPFVIYAVCDALGADIAGQIYIGVVVVLVVTAAMIWVEGFMAFKATTPPSEPGSPYPPATVIIPAYMPNEAETIVDTVNSFLRLQYPAPVQVIIAYNSPKPHMPVEDELTALAAQYAASQFSIEPVRVMGSTSKAQNVNAVIGRVRGRFVGIFDADHQPRPDSLERAWRWLSNGWDIVQGRCAIRNGEDSWVARMVAVEFAQIYAVSHPGRARFHGFGIFGGSNGFWRTSVLHETRMRRAMLTEDIDSSIRAVLAGYKIVGDRDLISEELAPTSLRQLLNQRLRWAQGWFQVSIRRVIPALLSPHVTIRQKLGLFHLLVWRELFPWYSIQVVPIMFYWVWVYGWDYIQWTIPIFLATTIFTFSTGPGQILFAYVLGQKSHRLPARWFVEYLFVSMLFCSPFKDTLSRIAHVKEAMRERAWKVTPRTAPTREPARQLSPIAAAMLLLLLLSPDPGLAQANDRSKRRGGAVQNGVSIQHIATLLGGEAATIHAARKAARDGRNADAARQFDKAITAVPSRRAELLPEYARALTYSNQSERALPLYREILAYPLTGPQRSEVLAVFANALTFSGRYKAALAVYDGALGRMADNADRAIRRARVLMWLGRPAEAIAGLDRVSPVLWATGPLAKLADEVLVEAARSFAKSGQLPLAGRTYNRAIRHNAALRSPLAREYADQLVNAGRPADAVPLYLSAIDDRFAPSTSRTAAMSGLVQAYARSGRPAEAFKTYIYALSGGTAADRTQPFAIVIGQLSTKERVGKVIASSGMSSDRLATAARLALAAGQFDSSSALIGKAVAECRDCRRQILKDYAGQLASAPSSRESVTAYRKALAGFTPGTEDHKLAQRGLAVAMTQSATPRRALAIWTSYLDSNPGDVDAILRQAQLFSALDEHGRAFSAYKAAYAIDPHRAAARRGIVDETVSLARIAAREDRNADAAKLFASAITLDSAKRREVLREYADQLSFGGHAATALPLYKEVISARGLSATDRKAAMIGLANASAWAGQFDDAQTHYLELTTAFPNDVNLKWTHLVFSARQNAQASKNSDSARLFAEAIGLIPERRRELIREYADQLTFANEPKDAIPLYQEVLAQPNLPDSETWAVKKGLAQAFDWSGRVAEANVAYGELAQQFPSDVTWRWNQLVVSARDAARNDRNPEAARLFAQAISLSPAISRSIVREYADQLTFTNRASKAIGFYRLVLDQPDLPKADWLTAKRGLANAYDWSGHFADAKIVYSELAADNPNDVSLKWNILIASARDAAKSDQNKEAAAFFAEAMKLMPASRISILREYADKLTFCGDVKQAIPFYRELVAQPSDPATVRQRTLDLALALAWDNQPVAALREYRQLAAANPDDLDAQSGVARMLSWAGNQSAAKRAYQQILNSRPSNGEAQRGLAQAEMWQGHHRTAQQILTRRLKEVPDDLEARRLLAQSQFWSGKPDKAINQLQIALGTANVPGPLKGSETRVAVAKLDLPPAENGARYRSIASGLGGLKTVLPK